MRKTVDPTLTFDTDSVRVILQSAQDWIDKVASGCFQHGLYAERKDPKDYCQNCRHRLHRFSGGVCRGFERIDIEGK